MNKFIHRNWLSDMVFDTGSDVNKERQNNTQQESDLTWNYSLIDVDELRVTVITTAKEIVQVLGKGLPICVYQLKLFNDLTKQGLKLKSDKSIINRCVETEDANNLIIVNDVLVIEYISSLNIFNHYDQRIKSYLHKNNYAMGLLISMTEAKCSEGSHIEISTINQNYIAH